MSHTGASPGSATKVQPKQDLPTANPATSTSSSKRDSNRHSSLKDTLDIPFTKCGLRPSVKYNFKTAGALWAVCPCGYMFPPKELPDSESTRMVLLFIIETFKNRPYCTRGGKLIILFDDMCHLLRTAIKHQDHHPEIKRFVAEVQHAVDKFHFTKNHKGRWCRLNVNPYSIAALNNTTAPINTSIMEQRNVRHLSAFKYAFRGLNKQRFAARLLEVTGTGP